MRNDHDPTRSGFGIGELGRAAHAKGQTINDNPMPTGSLAWLAWRDGYLSGTPASDRKQTLATQLERDRAEKPT